MNKTRLLPILVLVLATSLFSQSVNFRWGLFQPAARSDLWEINLENLVFKRADLRGSQFAIEYEQFVNRLFSFSFSIGGYSREVNTEYRDYETEKGNPIQQSMFLQINPYELHVRLYPLGYGAVFTPYLGVGGGIYAWKYEQYGDFINFQTMEISEGIAITKTIGFGAAAQAGFIWRFSRSLGMSLEGKYQWLRGELSSAFEDFKPLDMNGYLIRAGIHFFFRR